VTRASEIQDIIANTSTADFLFPIEVVVAEGDPDLAEAEALADEREALADVETEEFVGITPQACANSITPAASAGAKG
jgi:hypothetical protein